MRKNLKELLDKYYRLKNTPSELTQDKPDPLIVLKDYQNDESFEAIALICALLSYGNAKQIVLTLKKLDFSLLKTSLDSIKKAKFPSYRFQKACDIQNLFIIIYHITQTTSLKDIILKHYKKENNIIAGIYGIIEHIKESMQSLIPQSKSYGLDFLIGKSASNPKGASALKRWNMYLRWMVRKDCLDFGYWAKDIDTSHLILPLDTHTFKVCQKLGLLKRKTYDLQSAILATQSLKIFDPKDPIKYDFALYRLGQEKTLT
ncbi:TIGR02757 family protein [Helicobacter sp. 13S00477-4]|uniref:TIGR02757 family protein n=1 Tax=Helicobacter sp. 13S00477-4 TaxID=1905759 RepID=UPI000BA59E51|nr:TIGR02757 family protein [Helicobacter sp. 13S00477-4]PAF52813.1 TIGR02757 family protein [Helicobacter sp. 13S00477-4]